jgi:AcrR family transcriptional regulator
MTSRLTGGALARHGARTFKQKRAGQTYEALLEGAARVFARRGFDGAQTPEIAAEAGVSTGAFYRYFTDKRQAFVEMIARNLQRAHDDVIARLQPVRFDGDPRQAIEAAIDVLFTHVRRDAELERVYLAMSLRDPEVEQLRAEFEARGVDVLEQLIAHIIPHDRAPYPRAAALVISIAAVEVACERAGLRPRAGQPVDDAHVKEALRDMTLRYLFGDPSKPKSTRRRPRR